MELLNVLMAYARQPHALRRLHALIRQPHALRRPHALIRQPRALRQPHALRRPHALIRQPHVEIMIFVRIAQLVEDQMQYVLTALVRVPTHKLHVELQVVLVHHAQTLHLNASMVHVHVLITTMLVELTVRRVQPANIVNPLMAVINVYVTTQLVLVDLQDRVHHAQALHLNASMVHVHAPIQIMLVLTVLMVRVRHVILANTVILPTTVVHAHALITIMLVDLLVQHVHQVNIAN